MASNIKELTHAGSHAPLVQWLSQVLGPGVRVKVRLRGNNLHILCEAPRCPNAMSIMPRLVEALANTNLDSLLGSDLYQVLVYGRKQGMGNPPDWTEVIPLDRLDQYRERFHQDREGKILSLIPSHQGTSLVSNGRLASQGDPRAIARYLSETLSPKDVAVKVKIKTIRQQHSEPAIEVPKTYRRLDVRCFSDYSLDSSCSGAIATLLRDLELKGFQDAIIVSQIRGEAKPDWTLSVDLTPQFVRLRRWAVWGDVPAIARLLNGKMATYGVTVAAIAKESTLHLFCTGPTEPDKQLVRHEVESLLTSLKPQGIYAATLYGHLTGQGKPLWVDWLDLPASTDPERAVSTLKLAEQGDLAAVEISLNRLLNPDIDQQLLTGGIRVKVAQKADLLHVMLDAPVCPSKSQSAPLIAKFLRQLKISQFAGVRVYGRRSGTGLPDWNYAVDFSARERQQVSTDSPRVSTDRRDNSPTDRDNPSIGTLALEPQETIVETLKQCLLGSGLFMTAIPRDRVLVAGPEYRYQAEPRFIFNRKFLITIIWASLGFLLTLHVDWVLGNILLPRAVIEREGDGAISADKEHEIVSPYPSFNNQLLNEHLGRYHQLLQDSGAPDVLIVGSSRALRGVDPKVLRSALAAQGYADVSVYNFGVNGATAQVVDLIVHRIFTAEQLPKLILWADGTRAFNSGRSDLTYKAIASSVGYEQLVAGTLVRPSYGTSWNNNDRVSAHRSQASKTSKLWDWLNSYQQVEGWLDRVLGSTSALYPQRDRFKTMLGEQVNRLMPIARDDEQLVLEPEAANLVTTPGILESDGFLPFSIRFDPVTYYQNHPHVSGKYDQDYQAFNLSGEQGDALKALLELTDEYNIPVVFVNMPLTQEYLDDFRIKYEQQFQQQMQDLAVQTGLIFQDLSRLWDGSQPEYFSDPSHLNRYGADVISNYLASHPMIPWHVLKDNR